MAEVVGSKKIFSKRCITILNVLYPLLIIVGEVWTHYKFEYYDIQRVWLILISLGVLLFALVRIRTMINKTRIAVSLNVTYMALHVVVLVLLFVNNVLYVIVDFAKCFQPNSDARFWMVTVLRLTVLFSMTILLIILYKVSIGLKASRIRSEALKLLRSSEE